MTSETTSTQNALIWFYNKDDKKHGPVSGAQIVEMLNAEVIKPENFIWRQGMEKWLPANQTELIAQAVTAPPLPSGDMVPNKWVWVMALWPIIDAVVAIYLRDIDLKHCVAAMSMAAGICDGLVDVDSRIRDLKVMGFSLVFGSFFVIKDVDYPLDTSISLGHIGDNRGCSPCLPKSSPFASSSPASPMTMRA